MDPKWFLSESWVIALFFSACECISHDADNVFSQYMTLCKSSMGLLYNFANTEHIKCLIGYVYSYSYSIVTVMWTLAIEAMCIYTMI